MFNRSLYFDATFFFCLLTNELNPVPRDGFLLVHSTLWILSRKGHRHGFCLCPLCLVSLCPTFQPKVHPIPKQRSGMGHVLFCCFLATSCLKKSTRCEIICAVSGHMVCPFPQLLSFFFSDRLFPCFSHAVFDFSHEADRPSPMRLTQTDRSLLSPLVPAPVLDHPLSFLCFRPPCRKGFSPFVRFRRTRGMQAAACILPGKLPRGL